MDIIEARRLVYEEDIPSDAAPALELLARYSGIRRGTVELHARAIREQAWATFRMPTIGRWRFLRLIDPQTPHYCHAIGRLKGDQSEDVLLDLGCGMGQVVRQLVDDGADVSRVFGLDNQQRMIELGFELFCDRNRLGQQFLVGDILGEVDCLQQLKGTVTLVHATSFWHLFGWDDQVFVARRLVEVVLRPYGKGDRATGAVIFGDQVGSLQPGQFGSGRSNSFLHNEDSFQSLWDEVGRATGTKWRVSMQFVGTTLSQLPGVGLNTRSTSYGVYQIE